MTYTNSFVALLTVLYTVKFPETEGACVPIRNHNLCDKIEDLYYYNQDIDWVVIRPHPVKRYQKLQVVPGRAAQRIKSLQIENSINGVSPNAFENFIDLTNVILTDNRIPEIPVGLFNNFSLHTVEVTNCSLKSLAPGLLSDLKSLSFVQLSQNDLTWIKRGVFNGLPVAEILLQENFINLIDDGAFADMPNLLTLLLNRNRLATFDAPRYLTHASSLAKLHLDYNRLTQVTTFMLEGLENLQHLHLGHNQISSIEPLAFAQTPTLKLLALNHNHLQTLAGNILVPSGQDLESIFLHNNRLTYLSSSFLFRIKARSVSITGNPWQCPCLDIVLKWMVEKNVELLCGKSYFDGRRPVCVVPNSEKDCMYSYSENHLERFREQSAMYPAAEECPTIPDG